MAGDIVDCSPECERLASLVTAELARCWSGARIQLNQALADINAKLCGTNCIRDATDLPNATPATFDSLWGMAVPDFPCPCLFLYVIKDNDVWFKKAGTVGGWSLLTAAPQASIVHTSGIGPAWQEVDGSVVTAGNSLTATERLYANVTNNPSYSRDLNVSIHYAANLELYVPGTPGDGSTRSLQMTVKRNTGSYDRKIQLTYNDTKAASVGGAGGTAVYHTSDVVKIPAAGALVLSCKGLFINSVAPADSNITYTGALINTSGVTE